jgi:hypothetical protein
MQGRIIFSIFLIVVGLLVPWWVSLVLFVFGSYLYAPWFEGIGLGIFFDLVFGTHRLAFNGFELYYTAFALVSIGIMYFIKKRFINV